MLKDFGHRPQDPYTRPPRRTHPLLLLLATLCLLATALGFPIMRANMQALYPPTVTPTATQRRPIAAIASRASATPVITASPTPALSNPSTPSPSKPTQAMSLPESASPFSQGLLIVAIDEAGHTHLFAYQPLGAAFTRLTAGAWDDRSPSLSPDGTRLAFASNRDGQWDLYVLDLSSGNLTRVTNSVEYDSAPSWSPDGRWLAYESYAGNNLDIYIRPVDNSQAPIRLTDDPAADYAPAWSPQGRTIAFVSTRSGGPEIWLADLDNTDGRFQKLSQSPDSQESHPAWSPDGSRLAWASKTVDGIQNLYIWEADPSQSGQSAGSAGAAANLPRFVGSGDWPAWDPSGQVLVTAYETPNQFYLTGYSVNKHALVLPPVELTGPVSGLSWGRSDPSAIPSSTYALAAAQTPASLWQPILSLNGGSPGERKQVVPLQGVKAPTAMLQDETDEAFQALRERVSAAAGWDFLSDLENAYVPLTSPLPPGMSNDWLYTGRAFAYNTLLMNAEWLVVVREDFGAETYWRTYIKTRYQDGTQGEPLHDRPWNFNARYSGDPRAYEHGGAPAESIPGGYWLDFTQIASAYGWQRLAALNTWRSAYPTARFNEFVLTGGLDWRTAMLEVYPAEVMVSPTPMATPIIPSPTPRPTQTPGKGASSFPSLPATSVP